LRTRIISSECVIDTFGKTLGFLLTFAGGLFGRRLVRLQDAFDVGPFVAFFDHSCMTTRDIQEVVKELYGVEVSPTLVSQITARKLDAKTGKRKNLGTFATREDAERHERAVQVFKHRH
jgi:transposase-like protein